MSPYQQTNFYKYDAMSRLATLTGLGKTASYTRLPESDRLSRVDFGANYPAAVYSYDAQLRPTGKGEWTRVFNAKDEAIQQIPATGVQANNLNWYNSYDATGQLTQGVFGILSPEGPAGTMYNYSYDSIGNHLVPGVTYNKVNQPSNLTYDVNGNMTSDGTNEYAYDAENRLTRILGPLQYGTYRSGVVFHYDYAGRCYQRDNIGIETDPDFPEGNFQTPYEYIVYDGVKQIVTLDENTENITGKYVWQPASSGDTDVILWDQGGIYSTDQNKNVTGYHTIPEWSGQPSATYFDYTPFGEPLNGSRRFMFSSEERFTGTQYIQTNLILYLYRAYSPALKRWLTRDPIEEQGGVNLYNFVGNNPVTRWDNLGNNALCDVIGEAYVCVENSVVEVVESIFADDTIIVGSITGPVGDIVGGLRNALIGLNFNEGGMRSLNGVYRLLLYASVDIIAPVYGNTYRKYEAMRHTLGKENAQWTDYVLPVVIPNFGNYAGANWGYDQFPDYAPFMGVDTKTEYGSYDHDKNMNYEDPTFKCPPASKAHLLWIKNVALGRGIEPGAAGQAYRALGVVAFFAGSLIDKRNSR